MHHRLHGECSPGIAGIQDPEGFVTSCTYDSAGRVLTRSVAGNLSAYTYQNDSGRIDDHGLPEPGGARLHALHQRVEESAGFFVGLRGRSTYGFRNFRPLELIDARGNSLPQAFDGTGCSARPATVSTTGVHSAE